MCIDFSEVDDPEIRAAYEKTFPKFLSAKTVEEKNKNWWLLHKLGHWESKENGEDQPANDELQKWSWALSGKLQTIRMVSRMSELTPKQGLFVKEYLIDLNATQAAIRAGYSEKTAQEIGSENLSKPIIAEAINDQLDKRTKAVEITTDFILSGLKEIASNKDEQTKDRLKAFELLGKYKKLFTDRVENEQSGKIQVTLNVPSPKTN